jgi:hypothetical protein
MAVKSKAQRRKFAELLVKGEISPETFEEWNRGAGKAELPERLHPKADAKPKRKVKSQRKVKSKRAQKPKATATKKKARQPARKRG